ncbi:TonB system biopolymer transport component [Parvularcula bermudensis HTCC2503]|uniref:TonB system biopolymer transport component n=1 Tax=Parvularcula bermudensis (strain ATCC BAA-594 / HTCC2503 / KCTC 12087) TaxID=314260 RepID=E0THR1_PARBH|nr:MotA/TolQ/ExbB proton channel family protein [Parvularcula bermudensis]ADM09357.1 TonB system biopolymer transport component [Parvularcula bermudensis HTCC2503]
MSFFKTLRAGAAAVAAIVSAGIVVGHAQESEISLNDVLREARESRQQARQESEQRIAEFLRERNRQQERLATIRREVAAAEAESDQIEAQFRANDERIQELQSELERQQGEFGELFGAARSAAADLSAQLRNSVISAQYPGRAAALHEIAQSRTLPTVEELESIYLTHLQEMVGQSNVVTFDATVVTKDGETAAEEVTRIGPYAAFASGNYYTMEAAEGSPRPRLTELERQPQTANAVSNARRVENYSGDGYVAGTIDPTTGTLLELVVTSPSLKERFDQGGTVGYAIAIVFVIGMIIGVYKLVRLFTINMAVKGQVRKSTPSRGNPLGRVMMAYDSNTQADIETLQLKLDDAILRELPKLEGGLNLVKVLAAIAPLMGLLGTVVGMIVTFQQITLFGTGDPQIMAGGISQALVTTVLGLIASIPLLLLHAFASGSAKSVAQTLEEQAAGMIAEHAESR